MFLCIDLLFMYCISTCQRNILYITGIGMKSHLDQHTMFNAILILNIKETTLFLVPICIFCTFWELFIVDFSFAFTIEKYILYHDSHSTCFVDFIEFSGIIGSSGVTRLGSPPNLFAVYTFQQQLPSAVIRRTVRPASLLRL